MGEKRIIPAPLRQLLDWDSEISEKFVKFVDKNFGPLSKYHGHLKGLEYSCHGIPWFIASATFIFLLQNPSLIQLFVNLFFALVVDVIVVMVVKAITRRRRPTGNKISDMVTLAMVDKFSFPSGHATRAVMLCILIPLQYDLWFIVTAILLGWGGAVCVSRVLLRRHHILDVLAGVFIGILEAVFVSCVWLSPESAQAVVGYFLDETQVGASYDV